MEEVKSMGDDVEDKTEEEMLTILEACVRQFHQYRRQQLATQYMTRSLLSREREESESNEKYIGSVDEKSNHVPTTPPQPGVKCFEINRLLNQHQRRQSFSGGDFVSCTSSSNTS